jgi:cellulose synthase/poly-beta-1,6-N-acetylglucosamine synthase-like glycosyltransferase
VILNLIFGFLALLSLALTLWQWFVARRFPLHQRILSPLAPHSPVTLLKPLKGCDLATEDCLRSWFTQQYTGPVQILFGVAAADDPVCGIVRELLQTFPAADARLVVGNAIPGANAKVAKLAELERLAKHDLLVISDADVRVPPDLLANIVAQLCQEPPSSLVRGYADFQSAVSPICNRQGVVTSPDSGNCNRPAEYNSARQQIENLRYGPEMPASESQAHAKVPLAHPMGEGSGGRACGLVCCFYRLANPTTLAMRWEAIAINADFWSQVLQARSLKPIDFALGAVMAIRRQQLQEAGGFAGLVDCLADDYQLGHRLARRGHSIALSPVVAECWSAPMGWADAWKHQLRWARTIRVCQPTPYFFSLLSNATLWPLLWLILKPTGAVAACAFVCFLVRILTALDLQWRLNQNPNPGGRASSRAQFSEDLWAREDARPPAPAPWRHAWLVPVKDLLQAAIWLLAFLGNRIEWRGERLRLRGDGMLMRG